MNTELDHINSIDVVPANCVTFQEAAIYVTESLESGYNDMMKSIGVDELAVYESTGVDVLYEADDQKQKLIDKIKGWVSKAWATVKSLFEKAVSWVKSHVHDFKEAVRSQVTKVAAKGAKGLTGKLTPDVIAKIPENTKFIKIPDYEKVMGEANDSFAKFADYLSKKIDAIGDGDDVDFDEKYNFVAVRKELNKKLEDSTREITKVNIKSVVDDLNKYTSGDGFMKDIKDSYNTAKKSFDKLNQKVTNDIKAGRTANTSAELKAASRGMQYIANYFGLMVDKNKTRFTKYCLISLKALVAANRVISKEGKEKATNESASPATTEDLYSKAFDW